MCEQRHVRSAGVNVGDDRNGKPAARRPARWRKRVTGDDETLRLDRGGVHARRRRGKSDQPGSAGKDAAAAYAPLGRRLWRRQRRAFREGFVHGALSSALFMNGAFIAPNLRRFALRRTHRITVA